ncbi:STAS domain-containing protein [Alkalicoccus daliensis]|uniref:RsbT co-antagonist protein RsbR n=1 Tax=Alkalicoccus daliensis TaxID=745820 RepID=A0A1G9ZNK9_9BACI|nr:STAS domain-containing protein [Alkalicoccus daliensis]SDN22760.1 rsbT co-antagonist protein RsbR [Alkalicoccus daliensis]
MENSIIKKMGQSLIAENYSIAKEIHNNVFNKNHTINEEEALQYRAVFLTYIGEALAGDELENHLGKVEEWAKGLGNYSYAKNIPLDEVMIDLPIYRNSIYSFLSQRFAEEKMTFADFRSIIDQIDPIIDKVIYAFSQSYVNNHAAEFRKQSDELIELSVPIVPLTKNVAILPLIGTLDTYRAKLLTEKTLESAATLGITHLIIDLSGVHAVDAIVAQNLFQLHDALKLIGVTAIISGLRPELAQTLVSLGISFKNFLVVHSLPQALPLAGLSINLEG